MQSLTSTVARALAVRLARLWARVGDDAASVAVVAAPVARRVSHVDRVHLKLCIAARIAHRRIHKPDVRWQSSVMLLQLGEEIRHRLEQSGRPPHLDGQRSRIVSECRLVSVGPHLEE